MDSKRKRWAIVATVPLIVSAVTWVIVKFCWPGQIIAYRVWGLIFFSGVCVWGAIEITTQLKDLKVPELATLQEAVEKTERSPLSLLVSLLLPILCLFLLEILSLLGLLLLTKENW